MPLKEQIVTLKGTLSCTVPCTSWRMRLFDERHVRGYRALLRHYAAFKALCRYRAHFDRNEVKTHYPVPLGACVSLTQTYGSFPRIQGALKALWKCLTLKGILSCTVPCTSWRMRLFYERYVRGYRALLRHYAAFKALWECWAHFLRRVMENYPKETYTIYKETSTMYKETSTIYKETSTVYKETYTM